MDLARTIPLYFNALARYLLRYVLGVSARYFPYKQIWTRNSRNDVFLSKWRHQKILNSSWIVFKHFLTVHKRSWTFKFAPHMIESTYIVRKLWTSRILRCCITTEFRRWHKTTHFLWRQHWHCTLQKACFKCIVGIALSCSLRRWCKFWDNWIFYTQVLNDDSVHKCSWTVRKYNIFSWIDDLVIDDRWHW